MSQKEDQSTSQEDSVEYSRTSFRRKSYQQAEPPVEGGEGANKIITLGDSDWEDEHELITLSSDSEGPEFVEYVAANSKKPPPALQGPLPQPVVVEDIPTTNSTVSNPQEVGPSTSSIKEESEKKSKKRKRKQNSEPLNEAKKK